MGKASGDYDNPRASKRRAVRREWKWLDHSLTGEEKATLRGMLDDPEVATGRIFDLVDDGYTVKISTDSRGGGCRVILSDEHLSDDETIYALTGRGRTAHNALQSVLFKHYVIAQGDWTIFMGASDDAPEFD